MERLVQTTYVEMTEPSQAIPPNGDKRLVVHRAEIPCPEVCRFFFMAVGNDWWWYSRREWTREQWIEHAEREDRQTWIGSLDGTPMGYFELAFRPDDEVEILFFGLLPSFIGRGCGREFLAAAIDAAWQANPSRVWLHTCDLDHPRALDNYLAAGFQIFKTTEEFETLPDQPLEFWTHTPPWNPRPGRSSD